jgi:hypothetical protein
MSCPETSCVTEAKSLSRMLASLVSIELLPESALKTSVPRWSTAESLGTESPPPQPENASATANVVPDAHRVLFMVTFLRTAEKRAMATLGT